MSLYFHRPNAFVVTSTSHQRLDPRQIPQRSLSEGFQRPLLFNRIDKSSAGGVVERVRLAEEEPEPAFRDGVRGRAVDVASLLHALPVPQLEIGGRVVVLAADAQEAGERAFLACDLVGGVGAFCHIPDDDGVVEGAFLGLGIPPVDYVPGREFAPFQAGRPGVGVSFAEMVGEIFEAGVARLQWICGISVLLVIKFPGLRSARCRVSLSL